MIFIIVFPSKAFIKKQSSYRIHPIAQTSDLYE